MHFLLCFPKSIWQYGSTNLSVPEPAVHLVNCEILHSEYSVQLQRTFLSSLSNGSKENNVFSPIYGAHNYCGNSNWDSDRISFQNLPRYDLSLLNHIVSVLHVELPSGHCSEVQRKEVWSQGASTPDLVTCNWTIPEEQVTGGQEMWCGRSSHWLSVHFSLAHLDLS